MRDHTTKEKAKITTGAVASLVIMGWLVVLALAFLILSAPSFSILSVYPPRSSGL
jgi:hypothetical protein